MPKNKKEKKEKGEQVDWDKKKIFVFTAGVILVIVIFLNFKSMILGESTVKPKPQNFSAVKGISTQDLSNGIKSGVEQNINSLKTEAQNIDIVEIASSSPQVQKVLNDLRALKDLPKNQLKNACENICGKL